MAATNPASGIFSKYLLTLAFISSPGPLEKMSLLFEKNGLARNDHIVRTLSLIRKVRVNER